MNFALVLFLLLVLTGSVWFIDLLFFRKKRFAIAREAEEKFVEEEKKKLSDKEDPIQLAQIKERAKKISEPIALGPWWIEYPNSFFPIILIVFLLRSFVVEPFRIPSGSMMPTLIDGDFILVNKYTYGIRLPVINKKIIDINQPKRGDVMVFRYPEDPSVDYIKRVIGLPGDTIAYENKQLTINGQKIKLEKMEDYLNKIQYFKHYRETLNGVQHSILNDDYAPAYVASPESFPFRNQCLYNNVGFTCKVPAGHYFVLGDNRDNSKDSRIWGFVPEENIVGRAFFIWLNFSDLSRVGGFK